jgi:hypothetical protein
VIGSLDLVQTLLWTARRSRHHERSRQRAVARLDTSPRAARHTTRPGWSERRHANAGGAMALTVEIKSKASSPTAWLEVTYSGLVPPVSLFDDLAMVGWAPLPIPPPPASAIDWTRPDPSTGQQFTIEDYLVEGARVEPPRGSGPLGRWTDADRRAHFAVLEGVLRRHGLLDQVREGAPARPSTTPPSTAQPSPPPPPVTPPVAAAPAGSARIVATIVPSAEAAMATALANARVHGLSFTPVYRTIVHRYRGADNEQQVLDHLRLEVTAPVEEAETIRAVIVHAASAAGQASPEVVVDVAEAPPASAPDVPAGHGGAPKLRAVGEVRSA